MLAEKNDVQHVGVTMMLRIDIDANAKLIHAPRCWGDSAGKQYGLGEGLFLGGKVIDPRSIGKISIGQTMIYQLLCILSPSLGIGIACRGADEAHILKNQAEICRGHPARF